MVANIGGITISFNGLNDYLIRRISPFNENYYTNNKYYDMEISIMLADRISQPKGEVIVKDTTMWLKKTGIEEGYYIYIQDSNNGNIITLLESDINWTNVKIECIESDFIVSETIGSSIPTKWHYYYTFQMAGLAFRNRLIKKEGIQIHSSAIEYENKGLIFSAPSGTGKSTHTKLWKKMYGSKVTIINDDRPAIRFIEGKPMLCGSPWSGSNELYKNRIVPLQGIVMIEQSQINKIEKLPVTEVLQLLMPRCFMPYYDKGMMNEAMNTLERLIRDVPVYILKCRPDIEAVELVEKCLK